MHTSPVLEMQILRALFAAFVAFTFVQSGFDKALDYKGNLEYFRGHFSKSPLASVTGLLLPVVTLMEIAAGILSAAGFIMIFFGNYSIAFYGLLIAAVDLLSLLLGQRLAKDYVGAAGVVPYFIAVMLGLSVFVLS